MAHPGRQGKRALPACSRGKVVTDMRYLELTLPTMAENLALDEALLEEAEASSGPLETLRIWEPRDAGVVLGRSSRRKLEVNEDGCRERGVNVYRRSSGGLSILTGPGCLMYAVVLNITDRPELKSIPIAHQFVLGKLSAALGSYLSGISIRGTSDLALSDLKFSGNSLRVKRKCLLYHGTLLYDFPLDWIGACLLHPPRAPEYREGRIHTKFVTNLPLERAVIQSAVQQAFLDEAQLADLGTGQMQTPSWPEELTQRLVKQRFTDEAWTTAF